MDNLDPNSVTPSFSLDEFNKGDNKDKNLALEASAGTGKTFSIKEMVKRLVCEYHVGLDKILVVTYTEKAAGELKNEIRKVLTEPQEEYQNKSVIEVLKAQKLKVNVDVNNASIGTIHSFCKNTIEEFSIKSKQPLNLELAGEVTINDYAKRYIREGDILKKITVFLANKVEIDVDTLIDKLVATTNRYYLDNQFDPDSTVILYKKSYTVDDIPSVAFDLLKSSDVPATLKQKYPELADAYDVLHNYSGGIFPDWLNEFDNYYDFLLDNRTYKVVASSKDPNVITYPKSVCDAFKKLSKTKKMFNDFKPECYLVDEFLDDFYKSYQEYKEKNRLQNFNDMIRVVREELKDDNSPLLLKLRAKFTYGIIDEFQDTNQIQFDIFKKIFMSDTDHHIIVVGDPKQSIYAFQGADVTVYKNAIKEIEDAGGLKMRLDKNYRSYPGVVESGNKLFKNYTFNPKFESSKYCTIEQGDNFELRLLYEDKYAPGFWLNEKRLSPKDYAKFAVELILDAVTLKDDGHTKLQFERFKKGVPGSVIKDADFGDFVILCRTRTELPFIVKELKKAGIPVVRYKDDTLFKSKECAHWIALLEAIDAVDFTGHNRDFFKKALFTDFFGLSLSEISNPYYDQDDCAEIQMFLNWKAIAKDKRWEDLFDAIMFDTDLNGKLSDLPHLQPLGIYKQIASYAIDYLSNNYTLRDLIDHLKKIVKVSNEESEGDNASLVAKSTDFKAVSIMTMHASKGLQFPVVISVGGWKGQNTRGGCFTCHMKSGGGDSLQQYVFTFKDVEKESFKAANKAEFNEELLRLFYVAYTRSQYLLIAPRYEDSKDANKNQSQAMETFIEEFKGQKFDTGKGPNKITIEYYKLIDADKMSMTYKKMNEISKESIARAGQEAAKKQAIQNQGKSDDPDAQKRELKKIIKSEPEQIAYRHSYSNLSHPSKKEETYDESNILDREEEQEENLSEYDTECLPIKGKYDDVEPAKAEPDYPKGAAMGNAIHEVFENVNFENPEPNVEKIILDRFKSYGFDLTKNQKHLEYTKEDIVLEVLKAELPVIVGHEQNPGEYFRLGDLKEDDRKAEAEFNFNYPSEKLKNYFIGFIDLMFKRKVNDVDVYSILDWKSDTLSDTFESYKNPDDLKGQVDKRYSIQRVLYSYCLIMWLKSFYGDKETEEEIFENHFGGIYYVFVRGCHEGYTNGIYAQTWKSWADLKAAYEKIITIR